MSQPLPTSEFEKLDFSVSLPDLAEQVNLADLADSHVPQDLEKK